MIWFTADEHYGHENARTGWGDPAKARPFSSQDEMVEGLIERHNAVVKPGDVVYHLGDMFWRTCGTEQAIRIRQHLNGRHHYVFGNHEEVFDTATEGGRTLWAFFETLSQRIELRLPSNLPVHRSDEPTCKKAALHIVLDHYAGRVWNGSARGSWQLHGHSHGMLPDVGLLQMDVGVDCNGFAPVSLEQVAAFMRCKMDYTAKVLNSLA